MQMMVHVYRYMFWKMNYLLLCMHHFFRGFLSLFNGIIMHKWEYMFQKLDINVHIFFKYIYMFTLFTGNPKNLNLA